MVSCSLQGGLGNQMFQISAAYALALKNNDISVFNFNQCHTPNQGYPSNKYKDTIFKNVKTVDEYKPSVIYTEPSFSYKELPYHNNILLNGFFQSEKYFTGYEKEVCDLFSILDSDKALIRELVSIFKTVQKPITSVNIRRGDYLNHSDYHNVCTIGYYKKAIEIIGDSYFVFMSDDMNWVKDNFGNNENYIFPDLKNEILDLTMITMCDNNILSNSTFSWWGAYLNPNKNAIKIGPNKWFGPRGPKNYSDIIQKDWLTIDNHQ